MQKQHTMPLTRANRNASACRRKQLWGIACLTLVSLLTLTAIPHPVMAQTNKKKQPGLGTSGTDQMKGGDALVGTTYTFADNGMLVNCKLVSIEYSVKRFNVTGSNCIVPKVGEKLIILHWTVQNAGHGDQYLGGQFLPFATVAKDDQTRNNGNYCRLASAKDRLAITLKPGQRLPEELLEVGVVPADGPVPKLIVNYGRNGSGDKVTRYMLGKAPNTVKPLAADDSDPADPTGATARTQVPAKIGTVYPLGYYDFTINSISFVPGPIGTNSAGDGKRFLVVSVTVTNQQWSKNYFNNNFTVTLTTSDDEKTHDYLYLKGKRDEKAEGQMFDAGDTMTYRLAFTVPNDVTGKKLTLAETVDNMGNTSRALVFDLTGIK